MTERSTPAGDVLTSLNERVPNSFYWSLTLLATLGGFLFGYDTANVGSALSFIPFSMSPLAVGYLVGGASIGAAVGAISAGSLTDRFGRKSMLIIDAAIYAVGALLSAVAWNVEVLLIARTLIGLAIGADSAIATAYIAEYAPKKRRGALAMLQQWMITVGILVAYLIGLGILWLLPHRAFDLDWRLIFGLGAIPALIGLVFRTRMPESPRWLLRKERYDEAAKAFGMLGIEVTAEQARQSADEIARHESAGEQRISRWSRGVRRALFVVVGFLVFQQITGINVPLYYGPKLLAPFFQAGGSGKVASAMSGVAVTAIIATVNVAATYVAFRFIDRLGRRWLSMGGFAGMAVFMLVGAAGLFFTGGTTRIVIVALALNLFIASFAIGVGGTGWLLQGEVFPTAVRGRAASIGATADWVANFAIVLLFPIWQTAIGLAWVMVCFAVLAVLAIAFVGAFLPETKGLSVEEITQVFERASRDRAGGLSGRRDVAT
ncbi:MAG TPA: sugar porter family MFS transporter [Candidatus Dormibacteraeota bacterium]|nr:sugar porter family MFS transporter [Candidatus Dormibacteraeota bacterium]